MVPGHLDQMIEECVEVLAGEDVGEIKMLARHLAVRWPNEPALAICFALTSGASHLEDQFQDQVSRTHIAYKLAAIIAADIFALESMGQVPAKGQDLLHFWRRTEPYFFSL